LDLFAYVSIVLYYISTHGEVSIVRLRPVWMTDHPFSVLWHCWLGHQTCEISAPKRPKLCRVGR